MVVGFEETPFIYYCMILERYTSECPVVNSHAVVIYHMATVRGFEETPFIAYCMILERYTSMHFISRIRFFSLGFVATWKHIET